MSSTVYETIKASHELPSPTGVALQILELARDEGSTARQFATAVESDPAIATRLLKLVNSPLVGMSRRVASVQRAVALLGVRTVTSLALGFSLVSKHRGGCCSGFDYALFWSDSLARAVASRHLAHRLQNFAPDEAFTCGLLGQVGRLALATAFPEAYTNVLNAAGAENPQKLAETEQAVFGIDHNELAAEMMGDWHMPAIFREAIRALGTLELENLEPASRACQLARILHLAASTSSVLTKPAASRDTLSALALEAARLGIKPDQYHEMFDAISQDWREAGEVFSLRTRHVPPLAELYSQARERVDVLKEQWAVEASGTVAEADRAREGNSLRVLIVDDDPSALALLGRHLTAAGHRILTAENGVEAMRILLTEGPRVVITDWIMPEMGGLELCRAIRTHDGIPFTYVIIVTAQRKEEDCLVQAFEGGADDYLCKPFRPKELLARLRAGERIVKLREEVDGRNREVHRYNAELATANSRLTGANQELNRMAATDELTGLVNRREALTRLSDCWASAVRHGNPLAIIAMDIDRFKSFNDAYGHAAGDRILKETSTCLRRSARRGEAVCRMGGEEFLILCPSSSEAMAAVGAERLRRVVGANVIRWGEELELRVTISLGVAERTPDMKGPDDLLRAADQAMYAAKDAGRNIVCLASAGTDDSSVDDLLEVPRRVSANSTVQRASRVGCPKSRRGGLEASDARDPPARVASAPCGGPEGFDAPAEILVVDDDDSVRTLCRRLLEREGYQVSEADCGTEAIVRAEQQMPDVIIMDAVMPNMGGLECTRRLKANPDTQHIPVVVASARTDATDIVAGLEAGADEHLTKPLNPKELILRVKTMVRLRRELTRSNEVRGEQSRALGLLLDFSRDIAAAGSLDAVLERTIATTAALVCCRRVSIMLPDSDNRYLTVAKCLGLEPDEIAGLRVPMGTPVSGKVFQSRKAVLVSTVRGAKLHGSDPDAVLLSGVPSLSTALCASDCIVGVLNLAGRQGGRPFTPMELEYLDLICNIAAVSLDERQTRRARDEARYSIVIALAKLAEHRDPDTGKHVERVTKFSCLLAQHLRSVARFRPLITEEFLGDLQRAVPLHDIGKVAVSDSILRKPGPLTPEETAIMRTHASIGAKTIRNVSERVPGAGFLALAEEIAHAHHEWYDGQGYPRGLSGEAIPFAARIVALADTYDAVTTRRVYKEAMSHETAITIIMDSSGKQFDPEVVDAFRRCEGEFQRLAVELADDVAPSASPTQSDPVLPAASLVTAQSS